VHEDHEYGWNSELAEMIRAFADQHSIRCAIFKRDIGGIKGAYDRVKQFRPLTTVELHFNSAAVAATGSETLYGGAPSEHWASLLQEQMVKLYGRSPTDRSNHDRRLKLRDKAGQRGHASVTQLHPSALIEPFFAHVRNDAERGFHNKQGLAEAVVHAYANMVGMTLSGSTEPQPRPRCSALVDVRDKPDFVSLAELYAKTDIEFPSLKTITLAQWALESGWGESDLAKLHMNFAGMKANFKVQEILDQVPAEKVSYMAHDGRDFYLRFPNEAGFIKGFWMFMERPPYAGWRAHASKSPEDFMRFIGAKWAGKPDYAEAVIQIKNRLEAGRTECVGLPGNSGAINAAVIPDDAPMFRQMVAEFEPLLPEMVGCKAAILSHWALESNWGRSQLARAHMNFAGLDWLDILSDLAVKVPHPSDPNKGDYCRFLGFKQFQQGYAARFERDTAFTGWRAHVGSNEALLAFIAPRWRPGNDGYERALNRLLGRLSGTQPNAGATTTPGAPNLDGFVLHIKRTHSERNGTKTRTVGSYQAYFDRRKVKDISGTCYEPRGPGDNTASGIGKRCIEPGTYPLRTHIGRKYTTFGYADSRRHADLKRPGILVGRTNKRTAILIHPGIGFLASIGCINFSQALSGPSARMDYAESRRRVIDFIDAMSEKLGRDFPRRGTERITDGWLVIDGDATTLVSEDASAPIAEQAYALLAAAMGDGVEPDQVNVDAVATLVQKLADEGGALANLRDESDINLWRAWASGWESSAMIDDPHQRNEVQDQLRQIAGLLIDQGVAVGDNAGLHTPLVATAIADRVDGIAALIEQGAQIDGRDQCGLTPLLAAAFHGANGAFDYLFHNGADASVVTEQVEHADNGIEPDPLDLMQTEICPPGTDLVGCADFGRSLAQGNTALLDAYESILSVLWAARNIR